MVEKFYALYKDDIRNVEQTVDVFEAFDLQERAIAITNPKEKSPFYDLQTLLKVHPVHGKKSSKGAHFKYYPREASPLLDTSREVSYTPELIVFIRAFKDIDKFYIKEWEKTMIQVFPENMEQMKRIEQNGQIIIVKYLIQLDETHPYSYYYKWNGQLALEFKVTSEPTHVKRKILEKMDIPLFEANLKFPKDVTLPQTFQNKLDFENVALQVRRTYQDRRYFLSGKFSNQVKQTALNKERYETLSKYERQLEELQNQQSLKKEQVASLNKEIEKLEKELIELQKKAKSYNNVVISNERLQRLEDEKEKLKEDKDRLNKENNRLEDEKKLLIKDNNRLEDEKEVLENEKSVLSEENERLKQKGFLKRIFSRKTGR